MATEQKGKLFVISGPSASGKGTLCKQLVERTGMAISVSATTRKPRAGEEEGKSYFFLDKKTFERRIAAGAFLEYAKVYGNYYGTPRDYVLEQLKEGKDVILEIDMQGAMQVKKNYDCGVFIFILPPSLEALKSRILGRGTETKEEAALRLSRAVAEIRLLRDYDYYIVNDDLKEAVAHFAAIVTAEHARVEDANALIRRYTDGVTADGNA